MDLGQIVRADFAQAVDVDKQLGPGRGLALLQVVLKLQRIVSQVIEYQIQADIVVRAQAFDIGPVAEGRVDALVGQRRETTVGIRRERRQYMHPADSAAELVFDKISQIGQPRADAVGIGDQMDGIVQRHVQPP